MEAKSHMDTRGKVTLAVVALVAVIAGILSGAHIITLGLEVLPPGHEWQAWLAPIPIDGALLVASLSMAEARRQGRKAGAVVWSTLIAGIGGSIAANLAAAPPTLTAQLLAVSAPIALALSVEILLASSGKPETSSQIASGVLPDAAGPLTRSQIDSNGLNRTSEGEDTRESLSEAHRGSEPPKRSEDSPTAVKGIQKASPGQRAGTAEANRVIAEAYAATGVIPSRGTVRQEHRVGAKRADEIIALTRVMVNAAEARTLVAA
jgi:hypothetical protein